MRTILAALALLICLGPAFAVKPEEQLADPALEARARAISGGIRCLVCQNQSIDDSNAELARDLRLLVRERLKAGSSDQQVYDYLVSRYGEFVLLKPRLSEHTLFLWGAPAVLALIGVVAIGFFAASRNTKRKAVALTDEEKTRLQAILKE